MKELRLCRWYSVLKIYIIVDDDDELFDVVWLTDERHLLSEILTIANLRHPRAGVEPAQNLN